MGSVGLKDGRIQFRHPVVHDRRGYGIIVKKRVGTLPEVEQKQVVVDLEKLLRLQPRLRSEVPETSRIGPAATDIYFEPLTQQTADTERALRFAKLTQFFRRKGEELERFKRAKGIGTRPYIPTEYDDEFIDGLVKQIMDAEQSLNAVLKSNEEKDNIIEGIQKATGAQTAEQKSLTLDECFEHFKAHVTCRTENARYALLRRVRVVLEAIGMKTRHSVLTRKAIADAIARSKPGSETEALYRARDIRRFFRLLSWPRASDGLGLMNPADALTVGSQITLQRKRQQEGKIEILDPATLLKIDSLSLYWKALIAVLGYGGLRLAEAAALEWDRLDFQKGIIKVRPTALYPQLKSFMSARDVKPFAELWDHLTEYRKSARHSVLVFDHPLAGSPTWFRSDWFLLAGARTPAEASRGVDPELGRLFGAAHAIRKKTKRGVVEIKTVSCGGVPYRLMQTAESVRLYKGEPTASDLSGALSGAIGEALGMPCKLKNGRSVIVRTVREKNGRYLLRLDSGQALKVSKHDVVSIERPKEPARRLRRYWETTMRQKGLGDLIEAMGGHSDEVGKAHYTKYEQIVAAAKVGRAV
ncbi:MAG: hypothetical protein NTW87_05940 [Planctomycetota bacterium]|nr:hypothetical protein [Planctomycetota bacterium]